MWNTTKDALAVGDVVVYTTGSTWAHRDVMGRVIKVTPKGSVTIAQFDSSSAPITKRRNARGIVDCRKATDRELAIREWMLARPQRRHRHAMARFGIGPRHNEHDVTAIDVGNVTDSATARAAAKELLAIADWLDACPAKEL